MSKSFDVKVAGNGRMVLPAQVRTALGMHGDTRVTLVVRDGEAVLQPSAKRVLRAQALYREHAAKGRSVDEFLRARADEQQVRDAQLSAEAAEQ